MTKIILVMFLALSVYAKYPEWLQNSVKVVAEFEKPNQHVPRFIEGYGLVINHSLILTSATIVFDKEKAHDITLYHTEVLGQPIACLSHARILALDDNLDLAVLEVERFTDIYCNILPTPNFRELSFQGKCFDILYRPFKIPLREDLSISYFSEQDWSEFLRSRILLKDFLSLPKETKEKMLGMPLFIENEFLGLKVKESSDAQSEAFENGNSNSSRNFRFFMSIAN